MPELSTREDNERRLATAIVALLRQFTDDPDNAINALVVSKLRRDIREALANELGTVYAESYAQFVGELNMTAQFESLANQSRRWAGSYADELATAIVENTLASMAQGSPVSAESLAESQLRRGVLIAVTEVTRAITRAETDAAEMYERQNDGRIIWYWNAEDDVLVCEECEDCNGKTQDELPPKAANGPPLHPGCRCWRRYEYIAGI